MRYAECRRRTRGLLNATVKNFNGTFHESNS